MPYTFSFIAVLQSAAPAVVGPVAGPLPVFAQSFMAWGTFIGTIVSLVGLAWREAVYRTRREEDAKANKKELDGLGERVSAIGITQARDSQAAYARETAWQRTVDQLIAQHGGFIEKLGEARRASDGCNEQAREYFQEIGVKLDGIIKSIHETALEDERRMSAMETEIRLGREVRFNMRPAGTEARSTDHNNRDNDR